MKNNKYVIALALVAVLGVVSLLGNIASASSVFTSSMVVSNSNPHVGNTVNFTLTVKNVSGVSQTNINPKIWIEGGAVLVKGKDTFASNQTIQYSGSFVATAGKHFLDSSVGDAGATYATTKDTITAN